MILIKLNKSLLCFTEPELLSLLARDKELWIRALRRGKAVLRRRAEERRKGGVANGGNR